MEQTESDFYRNSDAGFYQQQQSVDSNVAHSEQMILNLDLSEQPSNHDAQSIQALQTQEQQKKEKPIKKASSLTQMEQRALERK